jgi:hypothetical protein
MIIIVIILSLHITDTIAQKIFNTRKSAKKVQQFTDSNNT